MFFLIMAQASGLLSTKMADLAFRLRASIPRAPVPANRSSTLAPSVRREMILNMDSLTLSDVGLVAIPVGAASFLPLHFPLMILILFFPNPGCKVNRVHADSSCRGLQIAFGLGYLLLEKLLFKSLLGLAPIAHGK